MSKMARQFAVMGSLCATFALSSGALAKPKIGDGSVLAPIGAQASYCAGSPTCNGGFPEGVVIVGDRVYVAGPANFGTAGKGPSIVTVLHRSNGNLLKEIPIQGEATEFEHALSGIAADGDGNVYALSTQLGVVRIERHGNHYTQSIYASALPDLPVCVPAGATPCSPTFVDLPPLTNEMTFDDDGNLYITDTLQATVFRVEPGGGAPEPWFQSAALAGNLFAPLPFGANGIRISPDRDWLYVVVTFDPADGSLSQIYRIPLVETPDEADMELFHTYEGGVTADSLAFGKSGKLYVTLAGSSQISVLDEDGDELSRISGPNGSPIPFDNPATMAFDDASKSILVTNHAIFGDPAHFAVLKVYVGEKGDPQPEPDVDGHCH